MKTARQDKILALLEDLAVKKGFKFNRQEVTNWQPRPRQRSFYTKGVLENGQRAFFKCSLKPSLYHNFRREIVFTNFIESRFPDLVANIYATSKEEESACWFLIEELDLEKGVIVSGEETAVLKPAWAEWVVAGLVKLRSLTDFPEKLWHYSYHQDYQGTAAFFQKRLEERLAVIASSQDIFPRKFPLEKAQRFVNQILPEIKAAENGQASLLQGDFAPNNLYFQPAESRVVFLDWEWSSLNRNLILTEAYDFANLYLRLWQNREFQQQFLDSFQKSRLASEKGLVVGVLLQSVNQLFGLVDRERHSEQGDYYRNHLQRLVESLEKVL